VKIYNEFADWFHLLTHPGVLVDSGFVVSVVPSEQSPPELEAAFLGRRP
jgi:hypothetical protein